MKLSNSDNITIILGLLREDKIFDRNNRIRSEKKRQSYFHSRFFQANVSRSTFSMNLHSVFCVDDGDQTIKFRVNEKESIEKK